MKKDEEKKTENIDKITKEENSIIKDIKSSSTGGTVVYIGPPIYNIVSQNTVFNNGIPEKLKEKIKECPIINSLLIPLQSYHQVLAELRSKGSVMSKLYEQVKSLI